MPSPQKLKDFELTLKFYTSGIFQTLELGSHAFGKMDGKHVFDLSTI